MVLGLLEVGGEKGNKINRSGIPCKILELNSLDRMKQSLWTQERPWHLAKTKKTSVGITLNANAPSPSPAQLPEC